MGEKIDRIISCIKESDGEQSSGYSMHTTEELHKWLLERKDKLQVSLEKITLEECTPWFYDKQMGCIRNEKNSFFRIYGIKQYEQGKLQTEQPIIEQDEIGFLGIISCKINNVWHYLMQAKIEPGNVNVVQLSPTLQATRSNFTRSHGGSSPAFLEYFMDMNPADIIVDQIQSEQSSRFLKKRNRNVILITHQVMEEPDSHRWITLAQIKEMMKHDNLVNMDTRTVLSCIPYVLLGQEGDVPFKNKPYFCKSAWSMNRKTIVDIYYAINNYKMFHPNQVQKTSLEALESWKMDGKEFSCVNPYPFKVIFCDISIEGREVTNWRQPLLAANGNALFGLLCCDDNGILKFLVKMRPEVGCFDGIEIGPTVQKEPNQLNLEDKIEQYFLKKLNSGSSIIADGMLSEEGGRFYQEENRNVILLIEKEELQDIPAGYVWSDYGTLNILTQVNNCLNIQLRNLLSLLEL